MGAERQLRCKAQTARARWRGAPQRRLAPAVRPSTPGKPSPRSSPLSLPGSRHPAADMRAASVSGPPALVSHVPWAQFRCVLQQRQGLSTGLASSVSSSKTATLTRSWKASFGVWTPSARSAAAKTDFLQTTQLCCAGWQIAYSRAQRGSRKQLRSAHAKSTLRENWLACATSFPLTTTAAQPS